ncbi:MAG: FadR/GntR family transcriptional regulator [Sandaracinaceae bacterium]
MVAPSAVDGCAAALRRQIVSGALQPGDRLPPERVLAVSLGVNRTTLRAALGKLAAARLLHVRQGSGYVVRDYRRVAGLELLPELAAVLQPNERAELVRDLLATRRQLAGLVFERIADRASTSADVPVTAVRDAVQAFSDAVADGATLDELAEADLAVTAAVLDASGSRALALCFNPVSVVVHGLPALRRQMYADPEGNVRGYRMLLSWLADPRRDALPMLERILAERDAATVARLSA